MCVCVSVCVCVCVCVGEIQSHLSVVPGSNSIYAGQRDNMTGALVLFLHEFSVLIPVSVRV